MNYTVQISDVSLGTPDGTDVWHFASKTDVLAAWHAGYYNTAFCTNFWGGALPAMSTAFTITVWKGWRDDVTDVYPDAEVRLSRQGRPRWYTV